MESTSMLQVMPNIPSTICHYIVMSLAMPEKFCRETKLSYDYRNYEG